MHSSCGGGRGHFWNWRGSDCRCRYRRSGLSGSRRDSGQGAAHGFLYGTRRAATQRPGHGDGRIRHADPGDLHGNLGKSHRHAAAGPHLGAVQKAAEKALVAAYEAGKTQNLSPIAGTNGEVLYAYGQSLPTLVTAPLHTSVIVLRSGMTGPKAIGLSPAYWQVEALMAGQQPELAVTPRFAGLHANLVVTGTSPSGKAMNYVIEVTSDKTRYTPMIGFYYPDAIVRTWKQDAAAKAAFAQKVSRQTVAVLPTIDAANLDFHWKIHCAGGGWFSDSDCRSIEPLRVFDDGKQTFIQFRPDQGSHGGIPSVLAENAAGQNAIVNTTFRDGYYIVDGVPHKILLLAGKGSSGKVVRLIHERN
ncbi:conjugal transfer protein TrbG/VirB9/CagX [Acidithiobacillus sp. GGI-221]|nr:conjugal transfer protein TrbG/VirB9/CagX [Acidithiobacillus sp. GGI-221]